MAKFRHFHNSVVELKSEDKSTKFKRYIEHEQQRFLDLMSGTLEEIYPSDFEEGITTLPADGPMSPRYPFTYMELPDTITTIGDRYFDRGTDIACNHIFPKNIKSVGCNCFWNESNPTKTRIADFSKAISVPSIKHIVDEDGFTNVSFSNYTVIKVPSSLYSTWKATEGWNHEELVSRIVRA